MKTKKVLGIASDGIKTILKKKKRLNGKEKISESKILKSIEKTQDNEVMVISELQKQDQSLDESTELPKDEHFLTAFVHFPKSINEDELKHFLTSHKIPYKEIRLVKKRRMCYIDFNFENDLMKFISLDKSRISDVELTIKKANKKFDASNKKMKCDEKQDGKRLFMKNLPYEVTKEELKKVFSSVIDMRLPQGNDKKLKGFGYLEFPDEEIANEVLMKLQNVIVGGRAIKLSKITHNEKTTIPRPNVPTCLLVKQLSFTVTKEMLKKTFKKSISTRIVQDPKTKKSQGYGFVEFENGDDAKDAMKEMQGRELEGRKMVISAALKKMTPNRTEKKTNKKKGKEGKKKKLNKSEDDD